MSLLQRENSANGARPRPRLAGVARGPVTLSLVGLLGVLLAGPLGGCELDSYLDPGVVGRWEQTPTRTPILNRLSSIEGVDDEFVDYSEVMPQDLVPEPVEYRLNAGDSIQLVVHGVLSSARPEIYQRFVDTRGYIDIPQAGEIQVAGLSGPEARERVEQAFSRFADNVLVELTVTSARQQTYYAMGAVRNPGSYFIPAADYRLLEALTTAGGFSENIPHVYVIRQIPLGNAVNAASTGGTASEFIPANVEERPSGEDLLDIIDDLAGEDDTGSFGSYSAQNGSAVQAVQPMNEPLAPAIELIEDDPIAPAPVARATAPSAQGGSSGWVFLNGEWVQVTRSAASVTGSPSALEPMATQRVIRVEVPPLIAGDARQNIVVRPGDVIRVPQLGGGNVYVAGQINRPGVYGLAPDLTLTRLVDAAGGYGALAIPDKVDLTRMVGDDYQATIRLNMRAIAEGTQPDIYIKTNDRVNIGTSFWATPLAVVRGGFRFSYGFGFLLDRNFGNDVFGAPPSNQNR